MEIAARLHVSPKTLNHDVSAVLAYAAKSRRMRTLLGGADEARTRAGVTGRKSS
ncbi:MAG: hypothetical protein ABI779_25385 [Acidobacteriota bacterium]